MNDSSVNLLELIICEFGDVADPIRLLRILIRLTIAAAIGGILGFQRERVGKSAGMRTHMLVTVGSAFFIIVPQLEGMPLGDMSRVVQGIIAGIGFLGGGVILKLKRDKEVHGLTTAAGIWFAAALGIAVGFGKLGSSLVAVVLAFTILEAVNWMERAEKAEPGSRG